MDPTGDTPTQLTAGGPNAIAVTQGLAGDEWTLRIVRYAMAGVTRYSDWLDRLPISHAVLTARLGSLVELGVLRKSQYQSRPSRYEYLLTRRGRDLWASLLAIWGWELAWVTDHAAPIPPMHHVPCDRDFQPIMTCGHCGIPVLPRDIVGSFGPAGGWARSVPMASTRRRSPRNEAVVAQVFPHTYALLGDRWSAAMIAAAFAGARQFKDYEKMLSAPPTVVTDRLRRFCDIGVFHQVPQRNRPDRVEYRLTDKGRAFFPVIMQTVAWGQRWFISPEGPAITFRHRVPEHNIDHVFTPRLACDQCRIELRGADIVNVDVSLALGQAQQ